MSLSIKRVIVEESIFIAFEISHVERVPLSFTSIRRKA
jgi:hypothetical protein